jgi:hypothetical protein
MQLRITTSGAVHCVYSEALDLSRFGAISIRRGSLVEPTDLGKWTADLSPVGGPILGPFLSRSLALAAEQEWLERYWLNAAT